MVKVLCRFVVDILAPMLLVAALWIEFLNKTRPDNKASAELRKLQLKSMTQMTAE